MFFFFARRSCFKHCSRPQALLDLSKRCSLRSRKVLESNTRSKKHETIVEVQKSFEQQTSWKARAPDCVFHVKLATNGATQACTCTCVRVNKCMNASISISTVILRADATHMSTLRRWLSKLEKRSVRRDPGGVAVLTCRIVRKTWFSGLKRNRTISQLIPSAVSFEKAGVEQFSLVRQTIHDQRNGECVVLDLCSNFKWARSSGNLGQPPGQAITLRGSWTGNDLLLLPSPCVHPRCT